MIPRKPVMDGVSFTHMYHVQNMVCGLWMFMDVCSHLSIPWEAKHINNWFAAKAQWKNDGHYSHAPIKSEKKIEKGLNHILNPSFNHT